METHTNDKIGKKKIAATIAILAGIIAVSAILLFFMIQSLQHKSGQGRTASNYPSQYAYEQKTAKNGMQLHILRTKPSNVTLAAVRNNVTLTDSYGINGGFFYNEALVSIAVVNGYPVGGAIGEYGSGGENIKYARGTLVWDGAKDRLSVQVASQSSELKVADRSRFWAQGGISMSLGDEDGWEEQASTENAPFPNDERLRSAAVYDESGMLYLVVSVTNGTLAAFRDAIVEEVGEGQLVDGVFLDGDGSSQLNSAEAKLTGDNRPVVQMIKIVK
ncbi:hypothetical protein [Paenibacillus sp. NPDC058071]|uniref:hypothetical protein n=1 Tax=Paenibacillus sp. NPDC058071 TaxID=3346326 RepID=UPI0036D7E00F